MCFVNNFWLNIIINLIGLFLKLIIFKYYILLYVFLRVLVLLSKLRRFYFVNIKMI